MNTNRAELLARRNEKYSFQDFTNQHLRAATDLNDIIVMGSCFYQVCPEDFLGDPLMHIFPKDMCGVTFVECNLDNVYVPLGNAMYECSHRRIKRMADGEYWFVDENIKPTEPIHKKRLLRLKENVDPNKIPAEKVSEADLREKRFRQMTIERGAKLEEL